MTSRESVESMTSEELCTYLEKQGVDKEDLKKIQQRNFDGKGLKSLISSDRAEYDRLGLSLSSTIKLLFTRDESNTESESITGNMLTIPCNPSMKDNVTPVGQSSSRKSKNKAVFGQE